MSDEGNINWRQLREFAEVDLTKSFVLSWHIEAETLFIDVDLFLRAEHPFYEKPRPSEKVCIRPACIEFPFCDELNSDEVKGSEVVEIAQKIGHGAIADLVVLDSGQYLISGEFGTVSINAERPILRLKGH